jgi:uncharacterized membrane protein
MYIVAITTIVYIVGWTAIPCFDKVALQHASQAALTWSVFFLTFIFMSTYMLIFTDNPNETISTALYQLPIWFSAGCTMVVFMAYFYLLHVKSMSYVVMLQPILLISQTCASIFIQHEPFDKWNVYGIGIVSIGMVVYNISFIIETCKTTFCGCVRCEV